MARSPRHYNKFTYSTMRQREDESPERSPRERLPSSNYVRRDMETCVTGLAPLMIGHDGYAIAEDGALSSRFVSPAKYTFPAVALVQVPMAVVARTKPPRGEAAVEFLQPQSPLRATSASPRSPGANPNNASLISQATNNNFDRSMATTVASPQRRVPSSPQGPASPERARTPSRARTPTRAGLTSPSPVAARVPEAIQENPQDQSSLVAVSSVSPAQARSAVMAPVRGAVVNTTVATQGKNQQVAMLSSVIPVRPLNPLTNENEAWAKLVAIASENFSEPELSELSWQTMESLLKHYNLINPIENAKIELAWRRKQGMLPSDQEAPLHPAVAAMSTEPVRGQNDTYYIPSNLVSQSTPTRTRAFSPEAASPRRSPGRYVPEYKQKHNFTSVSPKIDTGARRR